MKNNIASYILKKLRFLILAFPFSQEAFEYSEEISMKEVSHFCNVSPLYFLISVMFRSLTGGPFHEVTQIMYNES